LLPRLRVAPVVKQNPPKPLPRQRLQKLLRHHLIRVHIHPIDRLYKSCVCDERLHGKRAPPYSTNVTSNSRTSTKCPASAAPAATPDPPNALRLSRPSRP